MSDSPSTRGHKKPKLVKRLAWVFSVILFIVIVVYTAFKVSPWPSVLIIRYSFNKGGTKANEELAKYVPGGIGSRLDVQYDSSSSDTVFDLYYPEQNSIRRPLIIWVHGGGFVAGDKKDLSNYSKILASKDFMVAAINYSVAPGSRYPTPVNQLNTAIAFLMKNADEFNIETSQVFIAGDSGGAHIAAQLANIFTNSEYAALLGITPVVDATKSKG